MHFQVFIILHIEARAKLLPFPIFKCIFLKENVSISLKISLKSVPKVQISSIWALVQIMAWCWPSNKPLSEPVVAYVADAYMHHSVNELMVKVLQDYEASLF